MMVYPPANTTPQLADLILAIGIFIGPRRPCACKEKAGNAAGFCGIARRAQAPSFKSPHCRMKWVFAILGEWPILMEVNEWRRHWDCD
jgi:hypothetical protein